MFKKTATVVCALLCAASSLSTAATISFDFNNLGYGNTVGTYYNGGHDGFGRRLDMDYGVSFIGGSIKETPRGEYLAGGTYMQIDVQKVRAILGTDQYYISFNAARYDVDGGPTNVFYQYGPADPIVVGGNGNPHCPSDPSACNQVFYGTMGGYHTSFSEPGAQVTGIYFNVDRLDNVEIHAFNGSFTSPANIIGSFALDRDVPEPGSVALFGIGVGALFMSLRNKNKISFLKKTVAEPI